MISVLASVTALAFSQVNAAIPLKTFKLEGTSIQFSVPVTLKADTKSEEENPGMKKSSGLMGDLTKPSSSTQPPYIEIDVQWSPTLKLNRPFKSSEFAEGVKENWLNGEAFAGNRPIGNVSFMPLKEKSLDATAALADFANPRSTTAFVGIVSDNTFATIRLAYLSSDKKGMETVVNILTSIKSVKQ